MRDITADAKAIFLEALDRNGEDETTLTEDVDFKTGVLTIPSIHTAVFWPCAVSAARRYCGPILAKRKSSKLYVTGTV